MRIPEAFGGLVAGGVMVASLAGCGSPDREPVRDAEVAAGLEATLRPVAVEMAATAIQLSKGEDAVFGPSGDGTLGAIVDGEDGTMYDIFVSFEEGGEGNPESVERVSIHADGLETGVENRTTESYIILAPSQRLKDEEAWGASENFHDGRTDTGWTFDTVDDPTVDGVHQTAEDIAEDAQREFDEIVALAQSQQQ